jgi:hypothetical protein
LVAELERARGFQGREIVLVRLALGGFLAETPARYSAFATLVWVYYDRLLSNRLVALQRTEQATGPRGAYQITGPRWQPEGSSDLYGSLVSV